jgi:hypothetical protein
MDDAGRDLLVRGIAAAKAGSRDEARFFLEKFLRQGGGSDARIQAWRYLAHITDDPEDKKEYLGLILATDPLDGLARRDLAVLNGTLDPAHIVDPESGAGGRIAAQPASGVTQTPAVERLACTRCGSSRVVVHPDGNGLVCEHCQHRQPAGTAAPNIAIDGRDFAVAMWGGMGRRTPERTASTTCTGCGAPFLLAPGALSLTCPHCAAVHLVDNPEMRELLAPDALIRFGIGKQAAVDALEGLRLEQDIDEPFERLSAMYVPIWLFSFAGQVQWHGVEREPAGIGGEHRKPVAGTLTILDRHVLVPASPAFPDTLHRLLDDFDLADLVAYDPQYLADRPAEVYQVTLEEASRPARRRAIAAIREEAGEELTTIEHLELSFGRLGVDRFRLLLVPVWIARIATSGSPRLAIVNGQTGKAAADLPPGGFLSWLKQLWSGG